MSDCETMGDMGYYIMAWTTDCKGFPEVGDPKLSKINHAKI